MIPGIKPVNTARVSIILTTHNRAKLLIETINSLLTQSFKDFELIIVDDASKDQTPKVINEFLEKEKRAQSLRSEKNIGPGAARNLGISQSVGEYIAIMDDDDLAHPDRIEIMVSTMYLLVFPRIFFSSVTWLDDYMQETNIFPGIVKNGKFPEKPSDAFKLLYLESNKIPNTTIMTRRHIWDTFAYPEDPWIGEDWYLCMQLAASGIKMKSLSQPLVKQRRGQNRQGLLADSKKETFISQRRILKMIKEWLHGNNIHDFDHLHKLAWSNQIIRESRHFIGLKGFKMISQAFAIAPNNPKIVEQLDWYWMKIKTRFMKSRQ